VLKKTAFQLAEMPIAFASDPTALVEAVIIYLQDLDYESKRLKIERFGDQLEIEQ
jgi:ferredoxin-NADP reductase